jgi:hypothetical protein
MTAALFVAAAGRVGVSAQQPGAPPQGAQPPQGGPGAPGGRGPMQLKNVKVLKDVKPDQFQFVMQYIAASLGVQCNFCHVQGDNASDEKDTKKRAREMMQMVADINGRFFDGHPAMSCASCHNGHAKPVKTSPLAIEMTLEQAAAAAAARGRGRGAGGPGGAPGGAAAMGAPAAPGAPAAGGQGRGPGGPGRGEPPPPPPVTETVDQVLAKYVQALGGEQALQNAKTRVMTGTVTNRDLTTTNVTVQENAAGAYRIDLATQPNPTIRATNGTAAWAIGGGGGPNAGPNPRDLAGFQMEQGVRPADFALPLHLKQRYADLSVRKAYGTIDGKQVVVLSGHPYPNTLEALSFDRESGLLLRRSVTSGINGTEIAALAEQIDYSDYRDVSGVKVPFTVRYATWNAVTTEKFADVKINTPIADTVFAKPAAVPQQ